LINNGHWSHNRIIFVIAQKNSIANLWSPTWIIENFWLLVNVKLDYWNFLVINYGNWKLVTKIFQSPSSMIRNLGDHFGFFWSPKLIWPNIFNHQKKWLTSECVHPSEHV
jgi:hypothetical protein